MEGQMIAALLETAVQAIGMAIATGHEQEALSIRKQMAAQFGDEILPILDRATAETIGQSKFQSLMEDPSLRRTQMDTLRELENVYRSEGMTNADIAALQLQEGSVAARASADAANWQADQARRGLSGSGLNAMMGAAAGQNATNALANLGRGALSDARQRALQALEGAGRLAGGIREQDYRKMADAASAQDRINLFDAQQRQSTQLYNLGLTQQEFNNRMAQLQAKSNALAGVASGLDASAARTGARANAAGQQIMDAGIALDKYRESENKDGWDGTDWGTDF